MSQELLDRCISEGLCPIWGTKAIVNYVAGSENLETFSLRAGGRYIIARHTFLNISRDHINGLLSNSRLKEKLTTWIIQQHEMGVEAPFINDDVIETTLQRNLCSYSKRIENFFRWRFQESSATGLIWAPHDTEAV